MLVRGWVFLIRKTRVDERNFNIFLKGALQCFNFHSAVNQPRDID